MSKPIDYFCSEAIGQDLQGKTVRGGLATGVAQAAKIVIQLTAVPLLARLLQREDFGLIAMVAFFTGFAAMFVDAGLSMATVQRKEITRQQVSSLFWIASGLSLLVAGVVASCAPGIAWLYSEPKLTAITLALCVSFILSGLTIQHQALLRRTMQFNKLALAEVVSQAIGQAVGISWAWWQYGQPDDYWALVLIPIVAALVRMVLVWVLCRWTPSWPRFDRSVLPMLKFGANLSGSQMLNYFARNGDNALIGWYWGDASLGLYERAYKLLLFPLQSIVNPISSVAVPALCRLKEDPEGYRRFFRRGVEITSLVLLPIVGSSIVLADPLVMTMLGTQWRDAIPIFLALGPAALAATTAPATHWVYFSWGHTGQLLKLVLFNSSCILVGFVLTVPYGPFWVAVGFSTVICVIRVPNILLAFKPTPLQCGDLIIAMMVPALAAIAAAAVTIAARLLWAFPFAPNIQLLIGVALFGTTYAVAVLASPGRSQVGMIAKYFRSSISA